MFASLVVSTCSLSVEKAADLKAASPLTNCGCQCSSLTFVDSLGHTQGNCGSVDGTGARWCYTLPGASCQDLTPSARFPANPWSYEACATPPIGSFQCPTHYPAHYPAPAVVVAPHPVPAPTVVVSAPLVIPSDPHPCKKPKSIGAVRVSSHPGLAATAHGGEPWPAGNPQRTN